MSYGYNLKVRVDEVTWRRVQEAAQATGRNPSDLLREWIWERVRLPSAVVASGVGGPPTVDEQRSLAVDALARRFFLQASKWPEEDQVRWVRACIRDVPELVHADPHWVVFEMKSRAGLRVEVRETEPVRASEVGV